MAWGTGVNVTSGAPSEPHATEQPDAVELRILLRPSLHFRTLNL
jgi:hypothetical protein